MYKILNLFLKNLFTSGIFIALLLTLLEMILNNKKYLTFYAFLSSSFFVVNLIQFLIVSKNKNNFLSEQFLLHTMFGGLIFFILTYVMYLLIREKYNYREIIILTIIINIIFIGLYYLFFNY